MKTEPVAFSITPVWGCFGKDSFPSKSVALRVVKRMLSHRTHKARHGCPMTAFRCQVCHDWHVGSSSLPQDC